MRGLISGQLRLGDADMNCFSPAQVIAKLEAAHTLAGLNRLLFLPSHNTTLNARIMEYCRKNDLEVYLWYKVLADNDIIADRDELNQDAWGKCGAGESGVWSPIFNSEETFLFGCPRNRKYNDLLLARCRQALVDYDGLFTDCISFPLPSIGLESLFACFCPYCLKDEPRLERWRTRVYKLRDRIMSASDADLEKWQTLQGVVAASGLSEFFQFRNESITNLSHRYAGIAREAGKGFGLDVMTPAFSLLSGHDYAVLGTLADWLKPRIYMRVFGPSSIPLEIHRLIMGLRAWGKRYSIFAMLRFIERSTGIKLPGNIHALSEYALDHRTARSELEHARRLAPCPIHPALEFSLHPDYDTSLDETTVRNYLDAAADTDGVVLSWNLMYIPDDFLRIIGGTS